MELSDIDTKTPISEQDTNVGYVVEDPCVFCGKVIQHVNDGGVGCIAGAVVRGRVEYFLCNDPICEEHSPENPLRMECEWCEQEVTEGEHVRVVSDSGLGLNRYCSSDCLFIRLLSDRTDPDTFYEVQKLINLPESEQ